ncbi:GNAT family N-acetyltransferase [Myxococcus sp. AB056]|uniref:GNAT family N-acetyltransferase n=1 Tax=Myxococcus sp. AB056 TaxID=2562792 RepID=UPI001E413C65|nr:GNAT family N-acetyltransferase [Myxococcus sp. AB056]
MHLVVANEAQKAERDRHTYTAWGSPLTVEQFLEREQRLRVHPWSRDTMRTWLLCDDAGRVLTSCETFRTPSYLRGPDCQTTRGDSFVIASVYTEPALRGHGHATRLMDQVAAELERTEPDAQAAVLYSDVGARIYRRSGYQEVPAWDWHLPVGNGPVIHKVDTLLEDADVPSALERMRRPEVPFYLWPDATQVDWHLERERIYAELLRRPRPRACGAVVGASTALWAMMARQGELVVLMLDARSEDDAAALLEAAGAQAHKAGLSKVVLWEEPGTMPWVARLPEASREARDGSLPMVRPLCEGLPTAADIPFARALWA